MIALGNSLPKTFPLGGRCRPEGLTDEGSREAPEGSSLRPRSVDERILIVPGNGLQR